MSEYLDDTRVMFFIFDWHSLTEHYNTELLFARHGFFSIESDVKFMQKSFRISSEGLINSVPSQKKSHEKNPSWA